ncbi:helix-turn-helix domain-containing protein [Bacillus sp. NMCN1]|uniref:helix-turn-helix domain-containing protein n=1 Tax=Bacillus sp. NMCN1 TaxID=2108536 RepID=UPI000D02CB60|nr:helix-turn-helix transcriptional regulator [Bacillus sp. NMCN1]PRR92880.1 XRE family transcriptional regulator [Bacillus sp. NMCN1]
MKSSNHFSEFRGNLGQFLKVKRAYLNISSSELSRTLGKNRSYVSQIENGYNKKPDYITMRKMFRILGLPEEEIKPALKHFNISPSLEEEIEMHWEEEQERKIEEESQEAQNNPDYVPQKVLDYIEEQKSHEEIVVDKIDRISDNLKSALDLGYYGFNIAEGLYNCTEAMKSKKEFFLFFAHFFEDISPYNLDEKALLRVLNTLIEEENRINEEMIAFGKPRLREKIRSLNTSDDLWT